MIKLEHVEKYYYKGKANQIHVINDANMELPSRGIVALLGPSGCGKTTLLNAIGGLDKVGSGKIYIDGECITGRRNNKIDSIRNAKIGYIFQNFNLFDDKTVFENVALSLKMVGIKDKKIIEERVNYCLKSVGLYSYRFRNAGALSGGQRQRVAIARAIVKNPAIIIADEPTGNLDSANTIEVMNIIKTISKDRLVIIVTHERKLAEFYSDYVVLLEDGKILRGYRNDSSKYLDYQLENHIYLKDMPVHYEAQADETKINIYQDEKRQADIKLVFRGANLYIDTGGAYNVIGEDTNTEIIDDHYTPMDESVFDENRFDGRLHMPASFSPKYTSVYTFRNMITNGFKTLKGFKKMKKVLLIGFVFAAMFAFVGVSNILGIVDIEEENFMTTNAHYLSVANSKKDPELLTKLQTELSNMEDGGYVLPGNTRVKIGIPLDDYYQTKRALPKMSASLAYTSSLKADDLICGKMPEGPNDVVIDEFLVDKFVHNKSGKPIGIEKASQFVGRKLKIKDLSDFNICGVSKTNGPNLFVDQSKMMLILTNAEEANNDSSVDENIQMMFGFDEEIIEEENTKVRDFALRPSVYTLKKGRNPSSDFEAVAPYSHASELELNKTADVKVAGKKLKIVGFYSTDTLDDIYYTTSSTMNYAFIKKQEIASVYINGDNKPSENMADLKAAANKLSDAGYSVKINYDRDKEEYVAKMLKTYKSTFIVAAVLLLIAVIEMYLMLRSSFLARIKEVGIMRAIGLKKKDVYKMFAGEILVISVLTSIPGIALMYYIMTNIVKITPYLESIYMVNPLTAILTFGLLVVFNMIAGLLPVFNTLRKTPAEILARNDI